MTTETKAIVSAERDAGGALVVVFLRGGADGLNIVVPHGDDDYFRARPTIGVRRNKLADLDGFFGFNPQLGPLMRLWNEGRLAVVHGVGSEDTTRSHFEAQDLMEHGGLVAGGWVGRFLRQNPAVAGSPLAAVALGPSLPEALRGAPGAAAVSSIDDFSLGGDSDGFATELAALYRAAGGRIAGAGAGAMAALGKIEALAESPDTASGGAGYGDDRFSGGLREIARLIKGRVGLHAACIDVGGWDSHLTQHAVMDPPLGRLATGLDAFANDLGDAFDRTTVVVMTEFGRRVAENSALGTDHGRASVMFVLGGSVRDGGKVHAEWRGLGRDNLVGPGDLPVTINYRNVLAPALSRQAPGIDLGAVFPGFDLSPLAL